MTAKKKQARRKVLVLGTAPSLRKAPIEDKDWEVWGFAPGLAENDDRTGDVLPRWDRWFETHNPVLIKENLPDYYGWLAKQKQPVVTLHPCDDWPTAELYPRAEVVEMFGDWFLTSSAAWVMAYGLWQSLKGSPIAEFGIWGIHCAAVSEYGRQRPGVLHFMREYIEQGITIHIAPESDLLKIDRPYPELEEAPDLCAVLVRRDALMKRRAAVLEQKALILEAEQRLAGALDEVDELYRELKTMRPT